MRATYRRALPESGSGWAVHHALFARAGFTEAAQAEARTHEVMLVDLAMLDEGLSRWGSIPDMLKREEPGGFKW